ncbi:cysteine hydrolase [Bacillus sp. M6-12]|uniref:cysteine hydrolase family protein n=1 Tax=Bacillus sp. M6-12 TaxID=2054166 RepID=UPI000C75ABE3|nr:isochorismatase family cysteine hydrolase [Bacillus sp. M6-12]PLS18553.1 cysteine hydrolase [Bacillus sp. M6-12]
MPVVINTLDPKRTAILVIDMENDFVAEGAPMETPMGRNFVPQLAAFLDSCREKQMKVIYTTHVHREDGSDMGRYEDIWEPIRSRKGLVDGTEGIDIYPGVYPKDGEIVIKKHRYSGFFGTDLDIILRGSNIDSVAIVGVTTENCCHATARDAMFLGYKVAFISDLTGTFDYPDVGFGSIPAEEVHRVSLGILGVSTAHVMTSNAFLNIPLKQKAKELV